MHSSCHACSNVRGNIIQWGHFFPLLLSAEKLISKMWQFFPAFRSTVECQLASTIGAEREKELRLAPNFPKSFVHRNFKLTRIAFNRRCTMNTCGETWQMLAVKAEWCLNFVCPILNVHRVKWGVQWSSR
jgi:hypothetical protein